MKMSEPASVLQLNYKNNKDVINDIRPYWKISCFPERGLGFCDGIGR